MQAGTLQEFCQSLFPVFDVQQHLRKLDLNLTTEAAVFVAAVCEYVVVELLELAGIVARELKNGWLPLSALSASAPDLLF